MKKDNKDIILSVKNLRVNFSTDHGYVQAVRGVSFDLYKGETLCIVGESGSGKSVSSKTIMGILAANGRIVDGSIMYKGEDLTKVSEDEFHRIRGHEIGMIFQDPLSSLNPIVRIGKQITESMLVNSSRLKKKYNEIVTKELVAYKNAITEKKNGIMVAKDRIKFLKAECKKEIEKAKTQASEAASGKAYNIKLKYRDLIDQLENGLEVQRKQLEEQKLSKVITEEEFNSKVNDLTNANTASVNELKDQMNKELALVKEEKTEATSASKEKIKNLTEKYNNEIKEAKKNYKKARKDLAEKYNPIIKENRIKFKAKSKIAKKEVREYHKQIKKEARGKARELLKKLKTAKTEHARKLIAEKILKVRQEYIKSIRISKREAKAKALEIMREVGIPNPEKRYKQYPFEFSGGMRQRIVIAIALTASPEILICDEPTTALDVTIQAQILELINKLKAERGLSCIFITHDLGVVANMADRVAVMYAGKIVEYGLDTEIFYDPRHPYTWALLSSIPDIDSKEKLEAIPGTPPNMIYPPKGDAFALRSKYAMAIDFKKEPPMFKISDTHYAATWLLDPRAPKVEMPRIVKARIENSLKHYKEMGIEVL